MLLAWSSSATAYPRTIFLMANLDGRGDLELIRGAIISKSGGRDPLVPAVVPRGISL